MCDQSNPMVSGSEMFANYLEAIVETILPTEEGETTALLSEKSTSVSLVTLNSPIEKGNIQAQYYSSFKSELVP